MIIVQLAALALTCPCLPKQQQHRMAALMDEFTLEAVKDFMVSRGGRVTNHQLVNQFKPFLTNPAGKGEAERGAGLPGRVHLLLSPVI